MFREEVRQELMQLADTQAVPEQGTIEDSYGNRLVLRVDPRSGDIGLRCIEESGRSADVTFAGIGGGQHVPRIQEALRLLAHAIQAEAKQAT